jgi:hypothetical protein
MEQFVENKITTLFEILHRLTIITSGNGIRNNNCYSVMWDSEFTNKITTVVICVSSNKIHVTTYSSIIDNLYGSNKKADKKTTDTFSFTSSDIRILLSTLIIRCQLTNESKTDITKFKNYVYSKLFNGYHYEKIISKLFQHIIDLRTQLNNDSLVVTIGNYTSIFFIRSNELYLQCGNQYYDIFDILFKPKKHFQREDPDNFDVPNPIPLDIC